MSSRRCTSAQAEEASLDAVDGSLSISALCSFEKDGKEQTKKENNKEEKSKGMVVFPYLKGVTEQLKRVFGKHKIATSIKPHQTLRNILVHPKDKINTEDKTDVVYKVICKTCNKVHIGETG